MQYQTPEHKIRKRPVASICQPRLSLPPSLSFSLQRIRILAAVATPPKKKRKKNTEKAPLPPPPTKKIENKLTAHD